MVKDEEKENLHPRMKCDKCAFYVKDKIRRLETFWNIHTKREFKEVVSRDFCGHFKEVIRNIDRAKRCKHFVERKKIVVMDTWLGDVV